MVASFQSGEREIAEKGENKSKSNTIYRNVRTSIQSAGTVFARCSFKFRFHLIRVQISPFAKRASFTMCMHYSQHFSVTTREQRTHTHTNDFYCFILCHHSPCLFLADRRANGSGRTEKRNESE